MSKGGEALRRPLPSRRNEHSSSLVATADEPRRTRSAPAGIGETYHRHRQHHHRRSGHHRHQSRTATSVRRVPTTAPKVLEAPSDPAPPHRLSSHPVASADSPRTASLASTRSLIAQARNLKVKAMERGKAQARRRTRGSSSSGGVRSGQVLASKAEQHRAWLQELRQAAARRNEMSAHVRQKRSRAASRNSQQCPRCPTKGRRV